MSTKSCANCAREPSMAKNSSPSRARETGAQLQTTWRSAKKSSEPPKPTSRRHLTACRNNVQIFRCELRRETGTTNTMKMCDILPQASTEQPRSQAHRRPCQCTAHPETSQKPEQLWAPVSDHNRRKHKKHAISNTVHSDDELKQRHHPGGSKQDCRTCR